MYYCCCCIAQKVGLDWIGLKLIRAFLLCPLLIKIEGIEAPHTHTSSKPLPAGEAAPICPALTTSSSPHQYLPAIKSPRKQLIGLEQVERSYLSPFRNVLRVCLTCSKTGCFLSHAGPDSAASSTHPEAKVLRTRFPTY